MPQIVVESLLATYDIISTGPAVIWLHGWGSSRKVFADFTKSLPGYSHIMLDLPGFGESQAPGVDWGLEDYATFVRNFLRKINVTTYSLAGHSNGGAIAIYAAAMKVLSPECLVLLASAGVRSQPNQKFHRGLSWTLAKTGKMLTKPLPTNMQAKLRGQLYKSIGSDRLLDESMDGTFKKTTAEDLLKIAAKVEVPTLLLYGQQDQATPPKFGMLYHEAISGSELVVLEAGHFVFIDAPHESTKYVVKFLGEHYPTSSPNKSAQ